MHEDGVPLAETQAEMTYEQRVCYMLAKDYHGPDETNASGVDDGPSIDDIRGHI